MASAENAELVDSFEQFYRNYYDDEIKRLAQVYPNEERSLYLDWGDLYLHDPDLADDFISQPEQLLEYAEEALRLYDLPIDVSLGQAHVRIRNLPETTGIRDIRARHVNTLVSVTGIVRKATNVQPKIEEAAFECQRCGTLTRIPQDSGGFQEPHECQGCERQGPFQINFDQSEFVDAQKLRVQESPEGLRGGETPQSIDVHIEDDITGEVSPGDHVTATGTLRLEQQGSQGEKSPLFDVYMDGVSVAQEDEQFEDMEITEQDKQAIVELSTDETIYEQMVESIAPSIYGYDEEKLAIILQLFSGVRKNLPEGSRVRGDLHILLIGDPGTGKCVDGDTRVTVSDGSEIEIRDLVEDNLDDPIPVDDGYYQEVDFEVPSLEPDGSVSHERATKVWKREAPDRMYRVRTESGTELEVTPSHPLFVPEDGTFAPKRADELSEGEFLATAPSFDAVPDGGATGEARFRVDRSTDDALAVEDDVRNLRQLAGSDVRWDRIERIDVVDPDEEWVYDLEVEGTHNYVSNGVISHNSQLLQYIRNIAPRSVYTSGKGSSAAGLCVTGDTLVHTDDGFREIRDIAETEHPAPVTTETAAEKSVELETFDRTTGEMIAAESSLAWRMPQKECRRIETGHGKTLEASLSTPVLTCGAEGVEWKDVADVEPGDYVATPRYDDLDRPDVPVREFLELTTEKVDLDDESVAFIRRSLREAFGTLRDAAAALDLSEDFVYDSLRNRHVPLEKLDKVLDAIGATREDVGFDRLMVRHGDSITLPEVFDEDLLYLLGLVFGDGDISLDRRDENRGMIRISNGDERVLKRAADIFAERFDKHPEIERQEDKVPCIRVNSVTIARLFANAGMTTPKDDLALAPKLTVAKHSDAFLRGLMDADGAVSARDGGGSSVLLSTISEGLARQVQMLLETYGIRARIRERDRRGTYELADGRTIESKRIQHFVEIFGKDVDRYAEVVGFEVPEKQAALEGIVGDAPRRDEQIPVGGALATVDGPSGQYYMNRNRGDNPGRARARSMLEDLDLGSAEPLVREAVEADLRWDEVVEAENTGEKELFDLTVPGTHNFVGNGIVTHNTAAAVRDDFGDGQQWTLEAGALVLADRGIAAIDELDKMDSSDRSAMHEGLEQQEISISKAGINATLKSRCSLLGAANPKYGRFDEYEPIAEQIDLEPALISRFDLIFTVTDKPDEEEDKRLAEHILTTNYAGELNTQRKEMAAPDVTQEEVDAVTEEVEPAIEAELLRKYVAYAKQNCHPRMTEAAQEAIRDFYVDLRAQGEGEDSPVPVTARKLEALVRLAEASARVRLSDTVDVEDAERVIEIVRSSLQDIGVDPETGELDADFVETGTTKTQRDRIKNLKGLIREIEDEYDDGAPVDVVYERADEIGMDQGKLEHEIEKMKQKGELYEPQNGTLRLT